MIRFRPPFSILLCAILTLATSSALAQGTRPQQLSDPLDGSSFVIEVPVSTNGAGGYDSDFCTYAAGPITRPAGVVSGPSGFTARASDFSTPLSDEERDSATAVIASWQASRSAGTEAPPWEKFELAAMLYDALNRGAVARADLLLEGAWSARDQVVDFLPGLTGASAVQEGLTRLLPQLRSLTDERRREVGLHELARVAHRGGLPRLRDQLMSSYETFAPSTEALGFRERMYHFLAVEVRLMRAALSAYQEARTLGITSREERIRVTWLMAELHRRLGEDMPAAALRAEVRSEIPLPPKYRDELRAVEALVAWDASDGSGWQPAP